MGVGGALVAAGDGTGGCATLSGPRALALSPSGASVVFTDQFNNLVRSLDLRSGAVSTLAGNTSRGSADGPALAGAQLSYPTGLVYNASGALIVSDFGGVQIGRAHV